MSESTTGRVVFDYAQVQWLRSKSKKQVFIVHDDGTYLMSDSEEKGPDGRLLNIKPISGGWEAGRGDDFGESIALNDLLPVFPLVRNPKRLVLDFEPDTFDVWVDGECTACGRLFSNHEIRRTVETRKGGRLLFLCTKRRPVKH